MQANTSLDHDGNVSLKEYEPTLEGLIQYLMERDIQRYPVICHAVEHAVRVLLVHGYCLVMRS